MISLLRGCVRRYMSNMIFWISVALTIGLAINVGLGARTTYYDDAMTIAQMLINAILVTIIVGKEYREGGFRNKVIVGHTKAKIFVAELLAGVGISFILYTICAGIFVALNAYEIPLLPISLIVKIFLDYVLLNMCLTSIFVMVSCMFSNQTMVAIANIVFVLLMIAGSQRLYGNLSQPQYFEQYETVNSEWIDENGNIRYKEEKVEGSEYLVDNPTYVGGTKRRIYETLYNLSPYGHILEFVHFNMDWHGYDHVANKLAPELGMSAEAAWEMIIEDNVITEYQLEMFDVNLIYSFVLLVMVSGVGYFCFRKKELK